MRSLRSAANLRRVRRRISLLLSTSTSVFGTLDLALPGTAQADVVLSPSPGGHVGAWLVAEVPSRSDRSQAAKLTPARGELPTGIPGASRWSVASGGPSAVDLRKATSAQAHHAVAGAVLSLRDTFDGWLLISTDGDASILVDGRTALERAAIPHGSWSLSPLALAPGEHRVVASLSRAGKDWTLDARFLRREDLGTPEGLSWRLPGASDTEATEIARKLARVEVLAGLVPGGYQPRVHAEFPRGFVLEPPTAVLAVPLQHGRAAGATVTILPAGREVSTPEALEVSLPAVAVSPGGSVAPSLDGVEIRIGVQAEKRSLALDGRAPALVKRALELRQDVCAGGSDADTLFATLTNSARDLAGRIDRAENVDAAIAELEQLISTIQGGGDPLRKPGVHRLARTSPIDGYPSEMLVHVPNDFTDGGQPEYPLVVVLHGLHGTPERAMESFLGTASHAPHPGINGIVLAPDAHGDAFYRGPGESDVLEAVDWAKRTYHLHRHRVSITGISMGGTGAAELALKYPDQFAAAAPLAGYHSYFVRRDVAGRPIRQWEWTEFLRYSPASWADNAEGLFFDVVQGTRDLPLVHSRVLARRLRSLGYPHAEEWPEAGHDVWRIAWKDGKLFAPLSSHSQEPWPRHVFLHTDSLRHGQRNWVRITALEGNGPAWIDATATTDHVEIATSGVLAFELDPNMPFARLGGTIEAIVDGDVVTFPPDDTRTAESGTLALERGSGAWHSGRLEGRGLVKKAGLEGPLRDVASGPVAFVYGTLDPTQMRMAREVAEHFAARWAGSARFAVLADVAVPTALWHTHALFLVGSRTSNLLVREIDRELPMGIDGNAVRLGSSRITGDDDLGFACVFPNPRIPSRYVALVEAVGVRGLVRAMDLPQAIPDFIVFDSHVSKAAGQQVLGEASALAAGYFDRHWNVPASSADSIRAPPGADVQALEEQEFSAELRTRAAALKALRSKAAGSAPAEALRK